MAFTSPGGRPRIACHNFNNAMPILRSRDFGHLYVQANVETPQNLTRRQRELLQEFDKESSHRTQPESAGFFAKMKDFLGG